MENTEQDVRKPQKPIATTLCEVVDVDYGKRTVNLRVRINDLILGIVSPIAFCPTPACVPGGSFYLDVYKKENNGQLEYVLRSRGVDEAVERMELAKILGDS